QIASHHKYSIESFFLIGYLVHAGLQIDAIARAKNNPINLRRKVIEQNWIRLSARFFVSLMIFLYVWHNPSMVPSVIGFFGIQLSTNAIAILTLPMSPPVSGVMGFAADSLLAYIPLLKNALPPIEFTQVITKETLETKHTVEHSVVPVDSPDPTEK